MAPLAVLAVLVSAALHLYWNALVKGAKDPVSFSHQLQGIGAVAALPAGWMLGATSLPDSRALAFATISGLCYAVYYCALAGSYRLGQLSIAYPIVRGVAPAAAALAGIVVYREHPSSLAGFGVATVCAGALALGWLDFRSQAGPHPGRASALAVLAGLASSGYLLSDKSGVQHAHPVQYLALSFGLGFVFQGLLMRVLGLGPKWQSWREPVLWRAGIGCALGYVLILYVLTKAPVSLVVPVRAASVLFSVVAGHHLFAEERGAPKLVFATAILAGIVMIGLG